MNKRLFSLLIGLMSLSLLGIVFVQGYWIRNAFNAKEDQFSLGVRQLLIDVSRQIELRETEDYYQLYSGLVDSIDTPENINVTELIYRIVNEDKNETIIFSDGIIEEDYKLSSYFFEFEFDSIAFKKITNQKTTTKIISSLDDQGQVTETIVDFDRLRDFERKQFEEAVSNIASRMPLHKRVSAQEIQGLIERQATERGIKSKFEFAVYSNDLATKVRSRYFQLHPQSTYGVPLFVNDSFESQYQLYVNFSDKNREIFNSFFGMALLSLIFTSIIILTYSNTLSQLMRQRQISQIKTDFINNMTHEFKTPIATINFSLGCHEKSKSG